jgi:hypothetical protein
MTSGRFHEEAAIYAERLRAARSLDYQIVRDGYILITPVQPDLTRTTPSGLLEDQLVPRASAWSLRCRGLSDGR